MKLADLLALPIPPPVADPARGGVLVPSGVAVSPPVRVRALKDTTWSDGVTDHPHVRAGDVGLVVSAAACGFITHFDGRDTRQIMRAELLAEVEDAPEGA